MQQDYKEKWWSNYFKDRTKMSLSSICETRTDGWYVLIFYKKPEVAARFSITVWPSLIDLYNKERSNND